METGLRISDILNLKVGDIKKTMTVYETKSRRERTFKISDELYQELKKYTKYKKHASILFVGSRSCKQHVHRGTIHRRIKKALKTLKFNASAHSARKLYAQNIFRECGDVKKVQEALHHKNVATTATYLDISLEELINHVANVQQDEIVSQN